MADNRRQDEFTFELPAVEVCSLERRSGDKFQGKNSATVSPDHGCHSIRSRQTCSRSLITRLTRKSPETGIHRTQDYRPWQEWIPRTLTHELE